MSTLQRTTSPRTLALLRWEEANINAYLATFGRHPTIRRRAILDESHEFIRVLGFPLPGAYRTLSADMVLIVADFPANPPYGLYLLNSAKAQVDQIEALFHGHVARRRTPEKIPGYTWICYYYEARRWIYRPEAPAEGDNLAKFLHSFAAELQAGAER
jgi:hypothetical protein